MMKALLAVRFRALFAGMTKQGRQKKKQGVGTTVLLAVLYLYLGAMICGVMAMMFHSLAQPYHDAGLDWLYFSMAGTMALGLAVLGSVFTTQSQLYDAKDNDLLLAMPIPPGKILMSRMIPLLALNLLFAAIVMVPAMVVWAVFVRFSLLELLMQLICLIAVTLLAQAIACLLGWLLHLLLSKVNKSAASMIYMVAFLAIYFGIYSQAGEILTAMAVSGEAIARTLQHWVWPLYAMGLGSTGAIVYLLAFTGICTGIFALVYWLLSATFLHSATARRSGKRRRLDIRQAKAASAGSAIIQKELRHFLGCPVYLTNMGLGLILTAVLTVAGLIFRNTLLEALSPVLPVLQSLVPLLICAMLAFLVSTICISAPSISLEGKNLWILKSLPLSSRQILLGKLNFHCLLSVPVTFLAGLILSWAYGCSFADILLCAAIPALLSILNGLLGLICNLKWPRFDWLSEAYPCKQAAPVAIVMFSVMGLPVVFGALYYLLAQHISVTVFLLLAALILGAACFGLYKVLINWGVRKWEAL